MTLSKRMALLAAIAAWALGSAAPVQAKQTAIRAGRMIDGTGGQRA